MMARSWARCGLVLAAACVRWTDAFAMAPPSSPARPPRDVALAMTVEAPAMTARSFDAPELPEAGRVSADSCLIPGEPVVR